MFARLLVTAVALLTIAAVDAGTALAATRSTRAHPHMVLWNGGLRPGEPAYGFELLPDGHLREASGDGYGHIHVDDVLALSPADLAGVRGAVRDLLDHGPSVARDAGLDGNYTSIAIDAGAAQRAVLDTGQPSAYVQSLFARLGHAVKPNHKADVDPPPPDFPHTTACAPGHQATEVQKDVPLQDAAQAGILHIGPKGVIGGDSTRVKATWKDVAAPTTITVHIEIVNQPGDTTNYAQRVYETLSSAYQGYRIDGQPVNFSFAVGQRASDESPEPCAHEVRMHARPDIRPEMNDAYHGGESPLAGMWTATDPAAWVHEVTHMLGLDDQYDDYFFSYDHTVAFKLPENGLAGQELRNAIAPYTLKDGAVYSLIRLGHEHDLAGRGAAGDRLQQGALGAIASHAGLVIHNPPGLILVSKDGRQNFIVGSKFLVEVPYRKTVTLNGMVAYCMDFHREPPDEGSAGYDVLGLAGEQADPAMQALQRLMDVIAEREPGPLLETPGANGAIWRITDDRPAFDPDSRALLEAAGVDPDTEQLTFAAPHFDDPLPDGPTSALGAGGTVLPAPTAPVEGALPVARPPRLTRLRARSVIHLARPLIIGATATLTGSRDALSLSLERGRRRVAASPPQDSEPGRVRLGLALRHARPGRYRLVVHGRRAGTRTTKLVLRR